MSRSSAIELHIADLRRFARALATRHAGGPAGGRAEWIVRQSRRSVELESGRLDACQVRVLLFSAAVQHCRALTRQIKNEPGGDPQRGADFTDAVEALVAMPAEQRLAVRALTQLPGELREALLLIALAQLSYGEAAEALGLSLNDFFARLTRARTAYGALLAAQEKQSAAPFAGRAAQGHAGQRAPARKPAPQHLRLVK